MSSPIIRARITLSWLYEIFTTPEEFLTDAWTVIVFIMTCATMLGCSWLTPVALGLITFNVAFFTHNSAWTIAVAGTVITLIGVLGLASGRRWLCLLHLWLALPLPFIAICSTCTIATGARQQWIANLVSDPTSWTKISSAIRQDNTCGRAGPQAYNESLQESCCKPPSSCDNDKEVDVKMWTSSRNETIKYDPDCFNWSDDPNLLCYRCDSCKAGFISKENSNWIDGRVSLALMWCWCIAAYVYIIALTLDHWFS